MLNMTFGHCFAAQSPERRGTVWHEGEHQHLSLIIRCNIYITSISVFLTFHFARTPLITAIFIILILIIERIINIYFFCSQRDHIAHLGSDP